MSWHQFRYIFSNAVENAMRYSIEEAMRRQMNQEALGFTPTPAEVAKDAVDTFKRKMEKHAPSPQDFK